MSEIIDDIVILGRAVPERLNDGRVTVCLGGYSPTRGFIRLYPTRLKMKVSRWDVIKVEVEKNERDNRHESWKIIDSGGAWEEVIQKVEKVGKIKSPFERRQLVTGNLANCVEDLKSIQQSLGLIQPDKILKRYFNLNPQHGKMVQKLLFPEYDESWANVKSDFEHEPRLKYLCPECKTQQGYHDQKILEWGWFEFMRKNPGKREQLWANARFDSEKHDIFLFTGNQFRYPNSYLIISVIPIQKNPKPPKPKQHQLL
ncbi:MAG: hypothetical protein ACPG7F_03725 [Aggregatilineales bacterium]